MGLARNPSFCARRRCSQRRRAAAAISGSDSRAASAAGSAESRMRSKRSWTRRQCSGEESVAWSGMASIKEGAIGDAEGTDGDGSAGEFVMEEAAGEVPIALDGAGGDAEDFGDFLFGEAGKIAELDDFGGTGIDGVEAFQGLIQVHEEGAVLVGNGE